MKNPVVAVVGATGLVGGEIVDILLERNFPYSEIRLFASEASAGEVYEIGDDEVVIRALDADAFAGVDLALFAAGSQYSAEFVPLAVEQGAVVIDNSSYFRMQSEVPLIVPEVNATELSKHGGIIANPNCSTIQLVVVLAAIEKAAGLERVVVSTYQSVSGAGRVALDDLWAESVGIFNQKMPEDTCFPQQMAFNCIPQIDTFLDSGYTNEEMKVVNESRKIMNLPNLRITATAVRVPVFHSHAESVNVELKTELSRDQLIDALVQEPGISVTSEIEHYPHQVSVAGTDPVHVGRIRRDPSLQSGFDLWIVADNVRKGAALNAVQIAELLLE